MVEELSMSYRNYARGIKGLLLFAGLWPGKRHDHFANRLAPLIDALVCFAMGCFGLNFCRVHYNNLNLVTESIGIAVSFLTAVLKVVCFLANHRDLEDLHFTLEKHFEESLADRHVRTAIFDTLQIYVHPFFVITTLLSVGTVRFLLTPAVAIVAQLSHEIRPLNLKLPYPAKYPWPVEGTLSYSAHYFFEIMAGLYLLAVTSGVDSLFGYYVFQIRAIFRQISQRATSLGRGDENHDIAVRECVAKHRILVKCCQQLQMVYGPIVFWISLTSAIIMCTLIFQATQTRVWTVRYAIFTAAYIYVKLLQAFMYSWYGSVIFTESEKFGEAVYGCGWPGSGDKTLTTNVLIMMCHKPIELTACKFLIISTDVFTEIVSATMSYFFLLQTLDENK